MNQSENRFFRTARAFFLEEEKMNQTDKRQSGVPATAIMMAALRARHAALTHFEQPHDTTLLLGRIDAALRELGATSNEELVKAARAVVWARYYTGDDGWERLKEAVGRLEDLVGRPEAEDFTMSVEARETRADVGYRIYDKLTYYYPHTERAFREMRPLLCVTTNPEADHETFRHTFPTLTLREEPIVRPKDLVGRPETEES